MTAINSEQYPVKLRNCVIVGAGGAIGRALVAACLADRRCGTVFALSRNPGLPGHHVEEPDPRGLQPDNLQEHGDAPREQCPDRDRELSPTAGRDGGPGQRQPFAVEGSRPDETSAPGARWIAADPTDPDSLAAAVAAVRAITPRVHRLIICTGLLHGGGADPDLRPEKSLRQLRLENLQQCITVNAWAPLVTLDAFAPLLRHAEGAVAAALSAMVGSIGDNRLGGWYSYRMSKAALNMGIRSAAIELGRQGHPPVVVAIHPGTTRSELSAPFAGPERARPARESATAILRVLEGLGPEHTGRFFNWDGRELPW